jgi:hypothetical protein
MDDLVVTCPYCNEQCSLELEIDAEGSFVQDCDVCCRPWQVTVRRDGDGSPRVTVTRS